MDRGRSLSVEVDQVREQDLSFAYARVRAQSETLCEPLTVEDFGVQPMNDASPPKWHLAHTSWFFETFLLKPFQAGYEVFHPRFEYLFNSYYNGVGDPFPRHRRGLLSRPTVSEIFAYRRHVDQAMQTLLGSADGEVVQRIVLGLNHEQQHQELLLTDVKYNLGHNPLYPAYREDLDVSDEAIETTKLTFSNFASARGWIGAEAGFCFDNELPRHEVLIGSFGLADRVVTNAEYLEFIEDAGYARPELWLSDGWNWLHERRTTVQHELLCTPLYWVKADEQWLEYRLGGLFPLEMAAPVTHVCYYEADAYARFKGCRLPTEQEWETVAKKIERTVGLANIDNNFIENNRLHPSPSRRVGKTTQSACTQLFGGVWEWTASPYTPYPAYRPLAGALGEYNGKFMNNQLVLRGGSCVTPRDHIRASYRNFFYPGDRWQFSGIRLAHDI
ncbi:MAG: ergothioneine biosynthesis protein EgtB [Gammaproteobacteria bacterium]|nr:ergothioneine biosynthesis protein EgtB [Gammaproteobacteria bacterium]